jgi:hypothetical protein
VSLIRYDAGRRDIRVWVKTWSLCCEELRTEEERSRLYLRREENWRSDEIGEEENW